MKKVSSITLSDDRRSFSAVVGESGPSPGVFEFQPLTKENVANLTRRIVEEKLAEFLLTFESHVDSVLSKILDEVIIDLLGVERDTFRGWKVRQDSPIKGMLEARAIEAYKRRVEPEVDFDAVMDANKSNIHQLIEENIVRCLDWRTATGMQEKVLSRIKEETDKIAAASFEIAFERPPQTSPPSREKILRVRRIRRPRPTP